MTTHESRAATIAALNDAFRIGSRPELGRIMITSGARDVVAVYGPLGVSQLYRKVQEFDAFTEDNDPHKEHDFGSFEHLDTTFFWKIDYYDVKLEYGTENPEDESLSRRVLTIMLASEY